MARATDDVSIWKSIIVRNAYLTPLLLGLVAGSASAQQTRVYSYDAQGRMTSSGSSPTSSATYRFDQANNRNGKTCCEAIGASIYPNDFDPYFYLLIYPDIRAAGVNPYEHFMFNGYTEDRDPNQFFDTAWYRSTYGIPSSVNPLTDYHTAGWQAGRNPSLAFSTSLYLANNPDVAAAGIDPLWHYLSHGYAEGRARYPVL